MTIRMSPTAFSNTRAEHEVLARCVRERDAAHAEAIMRTHILDAAARSAPEGSPAPGGPPARLDGPQALDG